MCKNMQRDYHEFDTLGLDIQFYLQAVKKKLGQPVFQSMNSLSIVLDCNSNQIRTEFIQTLSSYMLKSQQKMKCFHPLQDGLYPLQDASLKIRKYIMNYTCQETKEIQA